jgi:hypothetical protein
MKKYYVYRYSTICRYEDYGKAVNHCVRFNQNLDSIKIMSRNSEIEEVCGRRGPGMPSQFPWEMDYFCPICGEPPTWDLFEKNEGEVLKLHFSEYNYFMWCAECNLDIPSFLCLRADSRTAVKFYSARFLDMIKTIKGQEDII